MCYYYSLSTNERQDGKPRANDQWSMAFSNVIRTTQTQISFGIWGFLHTFAPK